MSRLSGRLMGLVYARDKAGNFKVRTDDWPIPVVLESSADRKYKLGDALEFTVTSEGKVIDFSNRYRAREERILDLLLTDQKTGDVLIVGDWDNPPSICGNQGNINTQQYLFSPQLCRNQEDLQRLVALLGIDQDKVFTGIYTAEELPSLLQAALESKMHPDRIDLGRVVDQYIFNTQSPPQ